MGVTMGATKGLLPQAFISIIFIKRVMPTIESLKKRYKGKWLAIEVTKLSLGEPVEGKLIHHDKSRKRLWQKLDLSQDKEIYVTYAGPLIEEGYAVAFL